MQIINRKKIPPGEALWLRGLDRDLSYASTVAILAEVKKVPKEAPIGAFLYIFGQVNNHQIQEVLGMRGETVVFNAFKGALDKQDDAGLSNDFKDALNRQDVVALGYIFKDILDKHEAASLRNFFKDVLDRQDVAALGNFFKDVLDNRNDIDVDDIFIELGAATRWEAKGKAASKIATAKSLKEMGDPAEKIARVTGLSLDEITKL
ncbi:hypothetical protein LQZ19_07020 [Treponema primitia]|uniref:hypothetical protein n=1 Tax=Treponema primitia TaxID=88058 RepID=UPI003980AE8C